jgi:hypothetical protein
MSDNVFCLGYAMNSIETLETIYSRYKLLLALLSYQTFFTIYQKKTQFFSFNIKFNLYVVIYIIK